MLSCGAIPVIFSDGWVLPFSELLDYSSFSVRVAERDWNTTLAVLRAIPPAAVLKMRRAALAVYREHFEGFRQQIDTTLDIVRKQGAAVPLARRGPLIRRFEERQEANPNLAKSSYLFQRREEREREQQSGKGGKKKAKRKVKL